MQIIMYKIFVCNTFLWKLCKKKSRRSRCWKATIYYYKYPCTAYSYHHTRNQSTSAKHQDCLAII